MTSEERHEARYLRRKAKREEKRKQILKEHGDFYEIADRKTLARAAEEATIGVKYKASVKRFMLHRIVNVARLSNKLLHHEDVRMGFICFSLMERGKKRDIMSVHFAERVVQKSLNTNALVPVLMRSLVYDNGASQKGKGTSFAIERTVTHLRRFYRHYGNDGYVLVMDYHDFFASIDQTLAKKIVEEAFDDPNIIWLTDLFVDAYYEHNVKMARKRGEDPEQVKRVGLGLGSETNQTLAVAYPNRIDHYIKEVLRIKYFQRTMDDSILIHQSKKYLEYCLQEIKKKCADYGLTINEKKTQIVKLSHGFTYLKTRFILTESGKIIRKPCREAVTRTRQVMKKHRKMVDDEILSFEDAARSYSSRRGSFKGKTAGRTIYNLDSLFFRLFADEINNYPGRRWKWWPKQKL